MTTRLVLAWLHLLALAIGPAAVWARARALRQVLREPDDARAIPRALTADAWWGVAAGLWLITGLWRLFGSTEKSTSYYLPNHAFAAKMALFVAVVLLEIWPMKTLIGWRTGRREPAPRDAGRIEAISYVQCALVLAIVFAAVSMARGYGVVKARPTAGVSPAIDTLRALGAVPDTATASVHDAGSAPPAALPVAPSVAPTAAPAVPPSGSNVATPADLALLAREIAMPIAGIDPAKLHSNFNELRGGTRRHEALDIMSPRRTPVHAATNGRVLKLFASKAGGLMVYATDSSERFILMYAHLDSYAAGLRDGAPLKRGQTIGYVGFTGNASPSAPHLHFAVARSADVKRWSSGTAVDPLPMLQQAASEVRPR